LDGPAASRGDALQGIDAAQPHVELVTAQLLDSLGIPVGDLSLLGEPVSAGSNGEAAEGAQAGQPGDQAGSGQRLGRRSILRVRHVRIERRRHPPDEEDDPDQPD
jgi:hypothetical protein